MSDKKNNNEYPDISGLFDIDTEDLPEQLIPKDPASPAIKTRFLTAEEPSSLSKAEKKAAEKEKKAEIKKKKRSRLRKRIVITISVLLVFFIAFETISFFVADAKKPVITAQKPVEETISRYYSAKGVTVTEQNRLQIVFIDNDYDVHYIEKGQTVEIKSADSTVISGKVTDIKEQSPDTEYIRTYFSILTGTLPSTPVYAVFITPDSADTLEKDGIPLDIKVITKTSEKALTVASSAIQMTGNQHFVWIYSPFTKTLTKQDVRVGISSDGKTEIIAGIEKNDRVVISFSSAPETLYEGIKVKHS